MSSPILITMPTDNPELQEEIRQGLATHTNAEIQELPPAFGLEEIKLIVDIIAPTISVITVLTRFFLDLRDRYKRGGKRTEIQLARPGAPPLLLDEADEESIRLTLEAGKPE